MIYEKLSKNVPSVFRFVVTCIYGGSFFYIFLRMQQLLWPKILWPYRKKTYYIIIKWGTMWKHAIVLLTHLIQGKTDEKQIVSKGLCEKLARLHILKTREIFSCFIYMRHKFARELMHILFIDFYYVSVWTCVSSKMPQSESNKLNFPSEQVKKSINPK